MIKIQIKRPTGKKKTFSNRFWSVAGWGGSAETEIGQGAEARSINLNRRYPPNLPPNLVETKGIDYSVPCINII